MAARNIGSLTIDLILKTVGLTQGADKAQRELEKRAKAIERTAKQVGTAIGTALAVGGTAIAAATISMVRDVAQLGTELDKFSKISNTTTQEFQKWSFGAQMVGISQEKLADQFKDFNEKVGEFWQTGGGGMKDFFEQVAPQIGVTAEAFRNLSGPQALQLYFDSLEKANLSQDQMSFYLESMASDMTALIPLLRNGGEGFRNYGDEAERLGAVIDGPTMAAIQSLREQTTRLDQMMLGFKVTLAKELVPQLDVLITTLMRTAEETGIFETAVELVTNAARFGTSIMDAYANAVGRTSIAMETIANSASGFAEIMRNVGVGGLFNEGSVASGVQKVTDAFEQGQRQLDSLIAQQNNPWRNVRTGSSTVSSVTGGGKAGNPFAKPSSGGKSKEQQEAEQLQRSYESLMASMRERIALFNSEGEAAKVAYDLEHGALKALDDAKKQELLTEAQRYDALVKRREADEAAYQLAKEETRRIEEGLEYGKQVVSDLQFELELMRMTNAERATAIQLRGMEAEAVAEYGDAIRELNRVIEEEMENARFLDGVRSEFSGFITDVVTGTESIKDAFKSMLDNIAAMITQRIAEKWVEQLFGQQGSSGAGTSGGNWFGSIMGAIFGGGRASGGWAQPNRVYEVNEAGLEMATVRGRDYLLTGNSPVEITPNNRMGGGGGLSITQQFINPRMTNLQTDSQRAREEARKAQLAVRKV